MADDTKLDPAALVAVGRLGAELEAATRAYSASSESLRAFTAELRELSEEAELLRKAVLVLTERVTDRSKTPVERHGGTVDLKLGKASLYRALATLAVAAAAAFGGATWVNQEDSAGSKALPPPQTRTPAPPLPTTAGQ